MEAAMAATQTQGVHHFGLTVSRLEASAAFFVDTLGWHEVRRDPDYPAIFVSDGTVMVTLWQATEADSARPFDPRRQVGLHHVAFRVPSRAALDAIHQRLQTAPGVEMEFAPELLRQGPAWHTMCYEPSGIRVEFIWWPQEGA
jgi:catechol 2,3-dioxygenase-like lactoylglutathione lyase family enzyme